MRCILVFDHLNDVIFSKYDKKFVRHTQRLSQEQGLLDSADPLQEEDEAKLNINFIIQLFSPIVTSQRVMSSQFGNSYTSIQCQDGINMVFDEYLGNLFVCLGYEEMSWLKRMLGICMSIVQHLCGPDISVLRRNGSKSGLVCRLLDTWMGLVAKDQAVLTEALEQLTINQELSTASVAALKHATELVKSTLGFPKSHALLLVDNKFLALYSSKSAKELSSSEVLLLSLLCSGLRGYDYETGGSTDSHRPADPPEVRDVSSDESSSEDEDKFYSPPSSPEPSTMEDALSQPPPNPTPPLDENYEVSLGSELLMLSGNGYPGSVPHHLHIASIADGIHLVLLYQVSHELLCGGIMEAVHCSKVICNTPLGELDSLKRSIDQLEGAMKKVVDGIKKSKLSEASLRFSSCAKVVQLKWEGLKKQRKEESEAMGTTIILSTCASLAGSLTDLFHTVLLSVKPLARTTGPVHAIAARVSASMKDFYDFLKVKALRNFTLGSRASLTINKYLDELPELVHFIYLDRSSHRIIAPTLDFKSEATLSLTKKKVWAMVELSRTHLMEGHTPIYWRDSSFEYSYYLWFEDNSGTPLKPKVSLSSVVRTLPIPGVIGGDFYERLVQSCFPKTPAGKVLCLELYCVQLAGASERGARRTPASPFAQHLLHLL